MVNTILGDTKDFLYCFWQLDTFFWTFCLDLFCCFSFLAPPKFTRTPVDQTGVSGGVASFICQATGDPRPKIVWNKKGKKVSNQRFEVLGPLFCSSENIYFNIPWFFPIASYQWVFKNHSINAYHSLTEQKHFTSGRLFPIRGIAVLSARLVLTTTDQAWDWEVLWILNFPSLHSFPYFTNLRWSSTIHINDLWAEKLKYVCAVAIYDKCHVESN